MLYLIGFLASTKSLRHLLSQVCHLDQACEFWLDFEVSSNCTKTLVNLSLLRCFNTVTPKSLPPSIMSFSCIVMVLFISLMVFFRGELNISLVHHADHMSSKTGYSSVFVSFPLLLVEMFL